MSIFGNIVSAIFHRKGAAPAASAPSGASASPASAGAAASAGAGAAAGAAAASKAISQSDVEAMIAKIPNAQKFNWKTSIVDLMKLLDLDSDLDARKELAQELGYKGELNGSAEMNMWLHKQVMTKLAESGGVVPDSLKHA